MSNFDHFVSLFMTSSADMPADAAFQSERGDILYVWICSGDFSSSAKRSYIISGAFKNLIVNIEH